MQQTAILRIQCPDRPGIVAMISSWISEHKGNIIRSDQYSSDPIQGQFFMRLEFFIDAPSSKDVLEKSFEPIAEALNAGWKLNFKSDKPRFAILVSKHDHCLFELLYHWRTKEICGEVTNIISNHPDAESLAKQHQLPFHYLPITKSTKQEQEKTLLNRINDSTDFIVLARYMQILSPEFLAAYQKPIINIHHSFLPSFVGANPYAQAFERGVKIIGATAHYVTEDLDEGPIIAQRVEPISHHDSIDDLKRKGKHIEKATLFTAVSAHCERRVIRYGNKTIVFG